MNIRPILAEYDYPTAWSGWGAEEYAAIDRVVKSGQFTMGRETAALEEEFAAYHGMRYGIMLNSGSSANLIAVAALFHGQDALIAGDTALVPALAWSTSYAPLVQHGLDLRVCDIGYDWNADLRRADPEGCGLVIACSILGNPANEHGWADLAAREGAYLLIDNCESVGARTADGKLTGTRGIGNTFSFYFSHQLSAVEGGMILTDNKDYADACRMLRSHGWTRGVVQAITFESEYDFRAMGYNLRPVEMHAAIAREQLKKLDARKAARAKNYEAWLSLSSGLPVEHPVLNGEPSLFGIHFAVETQGARTRLAAALRAEGIDCRPPVGGSFLCHPYGAPWRHQSTPVADDLHYRGLFLGLAPFPMENLIERAVDVMRRTL